MRNTKLYFVFLFLSILFVGCNGEERIEKWPEIGNYYDSSKPIAFEAMAPDWGRINDSFIIKGNFPVDTTRKVKVFFADKEAVIVNNNGNELYGLIPKQLPGYNEVTLEVDGKKYTSPDVHFKYYQTQSVTTILGAFTDEDWTDGGGSIMLDEFRLTQGTGIATVAGQKGDNFIFLGGGWGDRTYFVSLDDRMVVKLTGIGFMGSVAVDNTREKATIMPREGGAVYTAAREDGWTLNSLGIKVPAQNYSGNNQGALAYAEDNRYVYCRGGEAFYRIDLEEKSYETMFNYSEFPEEFAGLNTKQWRSDITYSKFHKCFFFSFAENNGILKVWQDGSGKWNVERYAGFRSGGKTVLGDRLNDAVLREPMGMAVNSSGELYVCCGAGHCILKIDGRLVSLVAGNPDKSGKVNGFPTDAYFDRPLCIALDSEENFFIGEENSRAIRKMTIE